MNDSLKRKVRDNMSYLDHIQKQEDTGGMTSEEAEYSRDVFQSEGIASTSMYGLWNGLRSSPGELQQIINNQLTEEDECLYN